MPERLVVEPSGDVIATKVSYALTLRSRALGLLGEDEAPASSALVFERAKQIHTFGMRFAIDVLFCASDWKVLHVVHGMKPWRMSRIVLRSRFVVELPEGAAAGVVPGDRIRVAGQLERRL
jgi:uncharacterized membrane protein (UPF0127 family)